MISEESIKELEQLVGDATAKMKDCFSGSARETRMDEVEAEYIKANIKYALEASPKVPYSPPCEGE